MGKGYVIRAGHHGPQEALVGNANKDGEPIGTPTKVFFQVGAIGVINRARVWCRRVLPNGKLPLDANNVERPLEVTDPLYKGNLEFLEYGDQSTGASAIDVRWLPHSQSLDYQYQEVVQKITLRVEEGFDQIELMPGENKFDYATEANKIQLLKVHPQNRDSKSKNPNPAIKGHQFYEVTDEDSDKTFVKKLEAANVAAGFVIGLSEHPQRLLNLLELLGSQGITFEGVTKLSNDGDIYKALLKFSNENPAEFAIQINTYKKKVQDLFAWADSNKALDLTKDGVIAMKDATGKSTPIWENVEGKGGRMKEWVVENFLVEEVYDRTRQFKTLCDKLK